jgi:hypothetical protein
VSFPTPPSLALRLLLSAPSSPSPSLNAPQVYIGPGNQVRSGNNNVPLAPAVSFLGPYLQVGEEEGVGC